MGSFHDVCTQLLLRLSYPPTSITERNVSVTSSKLALRLKLSSILLVLEMFFKTRILMLYLLHLETEVSKGYCLFRKYLLVFLPVLLGPVQDPVSGMFNI